MTKSPSAKHGNSKLIPIHNNARLAEDGFDDGVGVEFI